MRIPVNVTANSGIVTADSGERDRWSVLRDLIVCRLAFFGVVSFLQLEFFNKKAPARAPQAPPLALVLPFGLGFYGATFLTHRLPGKRKAMMVLHQPIQHCIGNSLIPNPPMPMLNRQLTGDDGGTVTRPVINNLQQIGPGLTIHRRHTPIIEQQDVSVFESVEPACKGTIGMANAQLFAETRYT